MASKQFLVSGRVQGVFFRASTQKEAQRLGLVGFARNLDDGRVEIVAHGEAHALEQLHAYLHHGPPMARVDHIEERAIELELIPDSFVTR